MNETNKLTQQPVSNDQLKSISDLTLRQIFLEDEIAKTEAKLDELKDKLKQVAQTLIPEAMMSVGMESYTLGDGFKIKVSKFYSASIPDDKKPEAFIWLRGNGFDSIIKRNIICPFGRGEDKAAEALSLYLMKKKVAFEDKSAVHPQTLKAFVKEQIEAGNNLPMDVFGVFIGNQTKITRPTPAK